jgi:hypothetical protein
MSAQGSSERRIRETKNYPPSTWVILAEIVPLREEANIIIPVKKNSKRQQRNDMNGLFVSIWLDFHRVVMAAIHFCSSFLQAELVDET